MKLFVLEMEDCGIYSYQRHFTIAEDKEAALAYFIKHDSSVEERPHSITGYEAGEVIVEIY